MLNHLSILDINPTWLWQMIFVGNFSVYVMWDLEIKLRFSGLAGGTFTC